jgi:hypothetical protein
MGGLDYFLFSFSKASYLKVNAKQSWPDRGVFLCFLEKLYFAHENKKAF